MNNTVAIVGSHPKTNNLAPFADTSIDIWVFNEVAWKTGVPRASAVFQMHKPAIWKNPNNRNDPEHYQKLKDNKTLPVYMMEQYEEIPMAVRYPLEDVCDILGRFYRTNGESIRYFTSSIAYAIAQAINAGYKRIMLYGVEMETNTEYAYQRDGVFFWLGVAVGRGIEVQICDQSGLFRSPLYGYDGDVELNPAEFGKRLAEIEEALPKFKAQMEHARLVQDTAMHAAINSRDPQTTKAFNDSINNQTQAVVDYGICLGAIEENKRYQAKADAMETGPAAAVLFSRQEFEQSAAKASEFMQKVESLMATNGGAAKIAWTAWQNIDPKASQKQRNTVSSTYMLAHKKYMDAALQFGRWNGIVQENVRYLGIVDELVRMAGGEKSEEAMIAAREMEAVA